MSLREYCFSLGPAQIRVIGQDLENVKATILKPDITVKASIINKVSTQEPECLPQNNNH